MVTSCPAGDEIFMEDPFRLRSFGQSTAVTMWANHFSYTVQIHYSDLKMGTIASQITSLAIVYSTVYSDADQRKHQSSASQAFVR